MSPTIANHPPHRALRERSTTLILRHRWPQLIVLPVLGTALVCHFPGGGQISCHGRNKKCPAQVPPIYSKPPEAGFSGLGYFRRHEKQMKALMSIFANVVRLPPWFKTSATADDQMASAVATHKFISCTRHAL